MAPFPAYSYPYNQSYGYHGHELAHDDMFGVDQARSHGRHSSEGSFSQFSGIEYPYPEPEYVARANAKYDMTYHPNTMSAQAVEEDQRASYSPASSPISRHSSHMPSSPVARAPKESDGRAYCSHPACLDESGHSTKSYSRKADVARHHRSAHERRYIDCPFKKCIRKGDQGFTRIDHLVEHRRQFHMEGIPKKHTRTSEGRRNSSGSGSSKGRHAD